MVNMRWIGVAILIGLATFQIQGPVLADGDEAPGEAPSARQTVRTVQTAQGSVKLTLSQSPSVLRAGEEVQFEVKAVELVEGGLAGGELPLTDAKVTASLRRANRVTKAKLEGHNEEEPAVYGLRSTFESGGEYVLTTVLTTSDNRIFSAEFPVVIQSEPLNYVALGIQAGLALLALALIGRNLGAARSSHPTLISQVRATALPNVLVVVVAAIGVYAVGRWMPSFERRETAPVQIAAADTGNLLEVAKEAQIKFKILTGPALLERVTKTLAVNGSVVVRPQFQAEVMPPVAGKVLPTSKRYTTGDSVKEGTVLAVIEQTLPAQDAAALELNRLQIQTDRTRLEAEVRQARRKLSQAAINRQRAERLYALQAIPLKELQQTQLEAQLAEDDVKRATEQLGAYQTAGGDVSPTRRFEVRSPVTGVIVETALTPGEYVEPTKALFKVTDISRMWIEAQVYEKDLTMVTGSGTASFTVESYPGETFLIDGKTQGRLVTVGAAVDPQTRTIPVLYEVNNPAGKLKAGMFARILVVSTQTAEAVTIPKSAVYDDAGRKFIYVFLGGEKFEQREADTGIETTDRIQTRSGLKPDERVVVNGLRQLRTVALQGGK